MTSVSGLLVARAAITGATFMKFGRAPTTKQTLPGIGPAYLACLRGLSRCPLLALPGASRLDARPLSGGRVGRGARRAATGREGRRRADRDGRRRRVQRGGVDRTA